MGRKKLALGQIIEISWENLDEVYDYGNLPPHSKEEDVYNTLCKFSTPSDFYFALHRSTDFSSDEDEGATFIAIVPKVYFNKEKCMWDQSMFLDHILPDDMMESMESVWECDRPLEEVRKDLVSRGFEESEEIFQACAEY